MKIIIKPSVVGGLHWVESCYDSVQGRIASRWRKRSNQLALEITIPANTSATVFVPADNAASVTEPGKAATSSEGVTFLRMEHQAAVYRVASGTYCFRSTLPLGQPIKHL